MGDIDYEALIRQWILRQTPLRLYLWGTAIPDSTVPVEKILQALDGMVDVRLLT